MTYTETCPVCGFEVERDEPDAARNSVVAHMVSKIDADHDGIGYETALRKLEVAGLDEKLSETSAETPAETTDTSAETATETVTDGGPRQPPEPDISGPEEPPERYVTVEEYLRQFAEKNPRTAQTEEYREWTRKLKQTADYVDARESTGTTVVALETSEVPGA